MDTCLTGCGAKNATNTPAHTPKGHPSTKQPSQVSGGGCCWGDLVPAHCRNNFLRAGTLLPACRCKNRHFGLMWEQKAVKWHVPAHILHDSTYVPVLLPEQT